MMKSYEACLSRTATSWFIRTASQLSTAEHLFGYYFKDAWEEFWRLYWQVRP